MEPQDFQAELDKNVAEKKSQENDQAEIKAINKAGIKNVEATNANAESTANALKEVKGEVKVTNPDLAKTEDVASAVDAINKMNLTTFVASQDKYTQMAQNMLDLAQELKGVAESIQGNGKTLDSTLSGSIDKITAISDKLSSVNITSNKDIQTVLNNVLEAVKAIDIKPQVNVDSPTVNVPAPKVTVTGREVDLSPLKTLLEDIKTALSKDSTESDFSEVTRAVNDVQAAINGLTFPVANYVLPFKDVNGKAVQVQLDASGNVPVTGGGGGGGTQYAELTTTAPATGTAALGRYKSSAPTLTDGQLYALQLDASGNLKVAGSFSTTPPSDVAPATQNITVIDSSSSSAAGANNQTIIIGTPTAGSAASFSLSTIETVRVEVSGIWTGTVATETSIDGGITWVNQGVHQGAYTTSSFTAGFVGGCNVSGATNFRVRATAAITGTVVVKVVESVNTQSVYIANAAPSGNIVSVLNSSIATLTSGSVFTGTGEDTSNFAEIRVSVISNVASATDGLSLQQSPDNTNWDITDTYTIAAATGKTFTVPRQARYFRVVYTNGGTNQVSFRLQTILDRMPTAPSSNRAGDAYTNETDLVQSQTFQMVYNGTTWDRLREPTADSVTAIGMIASGLMGYNGSTWNRLSGMFISGDGNGNQTALDVNARVLVNNGSTWDRGRSVINATNSTGTGIAAAGLLAQFDDTSPTAITENQFGNLRMSANRNAYTTIRDAAGNERGVNVTAGNASQGDITSVAGTSVVTGGVAGSQSVGGPTASGSSLTASPLTGGGLAKTANPTAVTDGQVVNALHDKLGKQVVVGSIRDLKGNQFTTITSSTAETTVVTQVASTFLDVYGVIIENTSATASKVTFKDSTAGTTQFEIFVPAGDTRGFMLPESGAFKQTTVNTNWTATCGTSVASIVITMLYVKNT